MPTPPTWARPQAEAAPPSASKPRHEPAPSQPAVAAPVSAAVQDLKARQDKDWLAAFARMTQMHGKALSSLEVHHTRRMATITADVDNRLKELNGLSSRAGALANPADRNREIAYLVAKRQRSLADEKARQDMVKEELRAAQAREIAEAKGKHDRLAALQHQAVQAREVKAAEHITRPSLRPGHKDFER